MKRKKKQVMRHVVQTHRHSRKQRATGENGGRCACAVETREGGADAWVRVRVRRRRLSALSKTGNERSRALVVSRASARLTATKIFL